MAHELDINDKTGEAAMLNAGTNKLPWHGLGHQFGQELATAEEAIKYGGLDFNVSKRELIANLDGVETKVHNKFLTVRDDRSQILGVVGKDYTVLQNKEAFSFFDAVVEEGSAVYETAGSIMGGRKIWIMAKLPEYIKIGNSKNDEIQPYVTLMNAHDGKGAVIAFIHLTRIVCNNTLQAAIKGAISKVSIRHSTNVKTKVEDAHKILNIANQYTNEIKNIFDDMAQIKATPELITNYMDALYPVNEWAKNTKHRDRVCDTITDLMDYGTGQDTDAAKGSLYGLFNAVTHFLDHNKTYKNNDNKLDSIWFGPSSQKRQEAFEIAENIISLNKKLIY